MTSQPPHNLQSSHLRLRPDASIEELAVDETFCPRLMRGELGDFRNEYLVTTFSCQRDWPSWERHPNGDELVCLLSGEATMILETPGGNTEVTLAKAGDYAFVPRGVWHTAHMQVPTLMLFITAGEGTEHRTI
jgi:mannose-6-phosphate isomerase-like protein (cupin superfamily)